MLSTPPSDPFAASSFISEGCSAEDTASLAAEAEAEPAASAEAAPASSEPASAQDAAPFHAAAATAQPAACLPAQHRFRLPITRLMRTFPLPLRCLAFCLPS